MRILVTGGLGYIGSHTVSLLAKLDHEITILDNAANANPKVLDRLAELTGKTIPWKNLNITDQAQVDGLFELGNFEAVIHFAALKAVGESVAIPLDYYRVNVYGTVVLVNAMKKFGVKKLIYSSSASVYGNSGSDPLKETILLAPACPYASTKAMSERILEDFCASDPSFEATSLRYFNPVGAHPSGRIGEMSGQRPNNILPYIEQIAVGVQPQLNVFGSDYETRDGTGERDYIHIMDLAQGHIVALEKLKAGHEVYNLGTGRGTTVLELHAAYEAASEVKIPYELTARRAGDVAILLADPSKANEELGWTAEKTLQQVCEDSWNWIKNNPKGYEE